MLINQLRNLSIKSSLLILETMFMLMSSFARVHAVHLMHVDQRQAAANPQNKTTIVGCESASKLLVSTPTITI